MAASVSDLLAVVVRRAALIVEVLLLMLDCANLLDDEELLGELDQTYSPNQCLREKLGDGFGTNLRDRG